MRIGIMQPYFFPYIGYFQLLSTVDALVVYDNLEFSRKGWIHRNRILVNGAPAYITLSLHHDSDYLFINSRFLSHSYLKDNEKMLRRIEGAYKRAPYFHEVFQVIQDCLHFDSPNLFGFVLNSIKVVADFLSITTPIIVSSTLPIDHSLKKQDKVLALCTCLRASAYINPEGGVDLYDRNAFQSAGVDIQFLKACDVAYRQFEEHFVARLSIIDMLMFNSRNTIQEMLKSYKLF